VVDLSWNFLETLPEQVPISAISISAKKYSDKLLSLNFGQNIEQKLKTIMILEQILRLLHKFTTPGFEVG
jgi:hypothetical protein